MIQYTGRIVVYIHIPKIMEPIDKDYTMMYICVSTEVCVKYVYGNVWQAMH